MPNKTTAAAVPDYTLVCGLEIHAELNTASKMFCSCVNDPFNAAMPNTYTCPVCLGMPGGIPVANRAAIEWTIKLGLALGCKINLFSKFDRKHYFYPDLAKGYQISQYDLPFCYDGVVQTSYGPVRIRRIHLEEDTGKLQHTTVNGKKVSLIDFNRCGVPLVEIVTEPDIKSPEQAKEYAKIIRRTLRYLGIANCDMEQGGMRLEANTSLQTAQQVVAEELPTYKVEVKNINSFRFLEQAIGFEIQRQTLLLAEGTTPAQETRGWNSQHNTTFPQRSKEDAEDYRYFPDPDIPPIHFTEKKVEELRKSLPTMPDVIVQDWHKTYHLEPRYGETFVETQAEVAWAAQLFEQAVREGVEPNKLAAAMVNGKLGSYSPSDSFDNVLRAFKSLTTTDDVAADEINAAIEAVMAANPDPVARYQAGQTQLLNFFVGQTLKQLGKKVAVSQISEYLKAKLDR